ncbi:hypothetical protein FGO68_gene11412 [Halteria grandinella]|uniref:Uncharacterized protein n=1 Tax=Halteria grandinella TaxID=5974 RepID=A0A8J8P3V8_HALGN|nr:hypothetical protein FGO68_gene11412 [Halteria grandinella]
MKNGLQQRNLIDMLLYIRLIIVELQILTQGHGKSATDVKKSLQKLTNDIIHYVRTPRQVLLEQASNSKGIRLFTPDFLIQTLIYNAGLFQEHHWVSFDSLMLENKAAYYYQLSYTCPLIKHVEHSRLKRALQSIFRVSKQPERQLNFAKRLYSKYQIQLRCIQVIMEQCNEDSWVQEVLLTFVKDTIFEKMRDRDQFGFIAMRQGKKPFTALHLEAKYLNIKIKRKILSDFSFTSRVQQGEKVCSDLCQSLISCFEQMGLNSTEEQRYCRWVIAIVGGQKQSLKAIKSYIMRQRHQGLSNLIIIGVNIKNEALCNRYDAVCNLTTEGYFINLDFDQEREDYFFNTPGKGETHTPQYVQALQQVEASISLFDSKTLPLITEHIDFN